MKRLSQLLAAVAVTFLAPLSISGVAFAVSTCGVGFTGPDSQNMCTSVETYSCSVTDTNTVDITNSTEQSVFSGAVSASGNTSGGSSTSGSVTNTDGTTFSVTIINATGENQTEGTCTAAVVVPAVETPETVQPTSATATPVQTLPITSGDSPLIIVAIIAGVAVIGAALTVGAALLYRHFRAS